MTTQTNLPTKTQIDGLIATCLGAGLNEAAGLLTLVSAELSKYVRESDQTEDPEMSAKIDQIFLDMEITINNFRRKNVTNERTVTHMREVLAKMQENPDHRTIKADGVFSDADIKADYQERNDLYNIGMGA